jgi:hypothetical protein
VLHHTLLRRIVAGRSEFDPPTPYFARTNLIEENVDAVYPRR